MKNKLLITLTLILLTIATVGTEQVFAQEKKGDLDNFADDFGEEESEDDENSDDGSTEFFIWLFFEHIADVAQLWGGTPATEFGPYPSYPYAEPGGFMTYTNDYRSFFFNTEIGYHHVNETLRSYMLRWESQFVGRSKLSFDLEVYQEDRIDNNINSRFKDYLTFYGIRYGYALYRTRQLLVNIEGGYRGLHYKRHHGGPEIALDLQLFPRKPLILETKLAAAYVGKSPLYTVESSLGLALGRIEILGGIRLLKNKDQDMLDGFRLGLRIWY